MPSIWQRHPRYFLFVVVIVFGSLFLFNSYESPYSFRIQNYPHDVRDDSLPGRIARAERVYAKTMSDRKELIHRHGPTAHDISMFPPDKDPWPPYTVWSFFPPSFQCPHELERIGALGDGGKWVCGLSRIEQKPDCIIYSFGMSYESSFEAEMHDRTQYCQIWGFDYRTKWFGSPMKSGWRNHFSSYGLANKDAHSSSDKLKLYTLKSIMEMNKHEYIDLLKIDLEGWEFDVMREILEPYIQSGEPLPFGQLLLELHIWDRKFPEFLAFWEMLEAAGLRPFMTETNLVYQNYNKGRDTDLAEYSFLNIKGNNIFIVDPPPPQQESLAV